MSDKHDELVDSKQNHYMNFFVDRNSTDPFLALSKVYARSLTNIFYSVSNNILQMKGEYKLFSTRREKRDEFLNYSVRFICVFL